MLFHPYVGGIALLLVWRMNKTLTLFQLPFLSPCLAEVEKARNALIIYPSQLKLFK